MPVATGGLERSEIFGGADGEPLCIQQRQEAAFEAVIPNEKKAKKKLLELSFLQIFTNELVRKQTRSTTKMLKKKEKKLLQFQFNISVGTRFYV